MHVPSGQHLLTKYAMIAYVFVYHSAGSEIPHPLFKSTLGNTASVVAGLCVLTSAAIQLYMFVSTPASRLRLVSGLTFAH